MELHRDQAMSSLYTLHSLIWGHAVAFAQGGVMTCAAVVANGGAAPLSKFGDAVAWPGKRVFLASPQSG